LFDLLLLAGVKKKGIAFQQPLPAALEVPPAGGCKGGWLAILAGMDGPEFVVIGCCLAWRECLPKLWLFDLPLF